MPSDAAYRKSVEATTAYRLDLCKKSDSVSRALSPCPDLDVDRLCFFLQFDVIEESIGCGQVEELLVQAQDELNLVDKYIGGY